MVIAIEGNEIEGTAAVVGMMIVEVGKGTMTVMGTMIHANNEGTSLQGTSLDRGWVFDFPAFPPIVIRGKQRLYGILVLDRLFAPGRFYNPDLDYCERIGDSCTGTILRLLVWHCLRRY